MVVKKLKKLNLKWHLIFLMVILVAAMFVLFVKFPKFKIYLNETISTTGEFVRVMLQLFKSLFLVD